MSAFLRKSIWKQENLFLTADKTTFALNWLLRLELYPVEETLYCLLLRKLFLNLSINKLFITLSLINQFRLSVYCRAISLSNQNTQDNKSFWSIPHPRLSQHTSDDIEGLTEDEAKKRLTKHGLNPRTPKKKLDAFTLLLAQFKSSPNHYSHFAGALSFFLGDSINAAIC